MALFVIRKHSIGTTSELIPDGTKSTKLDGEYKAKVEESFEVPDEYTLSQCIDLYRRGVRPKRQMKS